MDEYGSERIGLDLVLTKVLTKPSDRSQARGTLPQLEEVGTSGPCARAALKT